MLDKLYINTKEGESDKKAKLNYRYGRNLENETENEKCRQKSLGYQFTELTLDRRIENRGKKTQMP